MLTIFQTRRFRLIAVLKMSDINFISLDKDMEGRLEQNSWTLEDQLNGDVDIVNQECSDEHQLVLIDNEESEIFETRFTFDLGRYLVAKTSFLRDDDIFVESPLILCPSGRNSEGLASSNFLCFACNKVIDRYDCLCCTRCRWYACSEECMREPWHTNFECSVFFKQNIIPSCDALKYVYLVRSLLTRKKNEAIWKEIVSLRSAVDCKDKKFLAQLKEDIDESFVFLNNKCKIDVDKILLEKLIQIFTINAFRLNRPDKDGNSYNGWALFSTSCHLSHNCAANLKWRFLPMNGDVEDRWRLILTANKPVKAGEVVSISYNDFYSMGTLERRQEIANSFHFLCKCPRCVDSSELGTNFSGIICFQCKEVMLPADPLNFDTDWKCTKCPARLAKFLVDKLRNTFSRDLEMILRNKNSLKNLEQFDALIHQCESKYLLYKNHSEVIRATMHWLFGINLNILTGSSKDVDDMYQIIVERAKRCLHVASTMGILYDLVLCEGIIAKSIIKYRFKSRNCLSTHHYEYTTKQKIIILKRLLKHLVRGLRVIRKNDNPHLFQHFQPMLQIYQFYREKLCNAHHQLNIPDDYNNRIQESESEKSISNMVCNNSSSSQSLNLTEF